MSESLDGKVAVVTGAASGIGLAAVEMLLGRGCTVVMVTRTCDRDVHGAPPRDILASLRPDPVVTAASCDYDRVRVSTDSGSGRN